jgi:hypothetical protein
MFGANGALKTTLSGCTLTTETCIALDRGMCSCR